MGYEARSLAETLFCEWHDNPQLPGVIADQLGRECNAPAARLNLEVRDNRGRLRNEHYIHRKVRRGNSRTRGVISKIEDLVDSPCVHLLSDSCSIL